MARRRHHVGPRRQDALVERDRLAQPAFVVQRDGVVHQAIDLDELLRVVALRVARLARRRSRHVSERAQPRRDVRRFGARRAGKRRVKHAEARGEHARPLALARDEISRLARIAR